MYKLIFSSLILIITACNTNEVVGLSGNNKVKKRLYLNLLK